MPGPGSSTGEDCAELHLPGNPDLLERVVDALVRAGDGAARRALPGEFSARAVLNGRMDLQGAQRVALVVAAATDAQLRAARTASSAPAGELPATIADQVATLLALVEAGIDFTDQEDVRAVAPAELAHRAHALAAELEGLVAAAAGAEAARAAPLVTLAGAPNAGKSSLFNALLGRERAVATPIAGTTRDVLIEPLPLPDGSTVLLADAPGLDEPREVLDVLVRQRAQQALQDADLVLWCAPCGEKAHPPHAAIPAHARVLCVTTKCDLARACTDDGATSGTSAAAPVHTNAHVGAEGATPVPAPVRTSAHTRTGLRELRAAIALALHGTAFVTGAERAALGALHRALVSEAAAALREAARTAIGAGAATRSVAESGAEPAVQPATTPYHVAQPELVAAALRTALDRLGEVAGAIPPDEVLGRLFSRFCVGK